MPGALWMVPTPLDFGGAAQPLGNVLPMVVIQQAAALRHWVVEDARSARGFLARVREVVPLQTPMQEMSICELPRPQKGSSSGLVAAARWDELLAPALAGADMGLASEAGLPALADPGAALVARAHALGVAVRPLPGASSLSLALAASGLNGQCFAFHGYLPTSAADRDKRIRELEAQSKAMGMTQVVIETPYRNNALLSALVASLKPQTMLSVTSGLTLPEQWIRSTPVFQWKHDAPELDNRVPAIFAWLAI